MSKKNKNLEKTEAEEQKHRELQEAYDAYVYRMQGRTEKDEKVEVKPYEKWVRKAKGTDENLNETITEVAGETGETKNEKFKRLAMKRMNKARTVLDTIMNLSSAQYESSPEEQAKIVTALRSKVLEIENSFKVKQKEIEDFVF